MLTFRVGPTAFLLAAALGAGSSAFGQGPQPPPQANPEAAKQAIARALDDSYPDRPEWVDMFADIVQGSQLGPNDGWFRKAVATSRFGWNATRGKYDKDNDGRVGRVELGAPEADFKRLDRDGDGALTAPDFDFAAHALTPSPGMMLFFQLDTDGNGKVTPEEMTGFFQATDAGGLGFLSLDDLKAAFLPSPRSAPSPGDRKTSPADAKAASTPRTGGPTTETLVRGLFRQEIGSLQTGPLLGESAPDFTLKTNDGERDVTLSKLVGPKPVVLVFGNFTCGPFRSQAGNVEKLYRMYKDRATFVMVYVREAHPIDGWRMDSNDMVEVSLAQPKTYDERVKAAQLCSSRLKLGFPTLVDAIDDTVGARYSGMPSRLYVIDPKGVVAYKSGRGPFGFKPSELEQSLLLLLRETEHAPSDRQADAR